MKIALLQLNATADVDANLAALLEAGQSAAYQGARLLLAPEAATCAFDGDPGAFARERATEVHERLATAARQWNVAFVVGSFTAAEDGRIHNTQLAFLPDGVWRAYDKIHLFDAFGHLESETIAPGSTPVTFSFEGVRFGMSTCYDVRFPELYTRLARDGAHALLVGASWGDGPGKAAQWDTLTRARALDAASWVLACGQSVRDLERVGEPTGAPLGVGHSAVVRPDGIDVTRAGASPEIVYAEIDVTAAEDFRRAVPVLRHGRLRGA
ncbi:MAG: nitrilase-related carbon-nitrogen hydrolase [Micrococcus sp.]|nr:nitrilase-related carbon-nitrogen hydrolase [Micrococcus sp.]